MLNIVLLLYLCILSWDVVILFLNKPIKHGLQTLGDHSQGNLRWIFNYIKPACNSLTSSKTLCNNAMFYFCGVDKLSYINEVGGLIRNQCVFAHNCFYTQSRLPIYLSQNPDTTSVRTVVHFAQMMNSGRVQKYDYGLLKNMLEYGQVTLTKTSAVMFFKVDSLLQLSPPKFDIGDLQVDTVVFHSPMDALGQPGDVNPMLSKIGHRLKAAFSIGDYSHLDFIWATNVRERIYSKMLPFL